MNGNNQMQTHWKTTTAAAVTAFFGFVLFAPELFATYPVVVALAKYGAFGGFVAFGVVASDKGKGGR